MSGSLVVERPGNSKGQGCNLFRIRRGSVITSVHKLFTQVRIFQIEPGTFQFKIDKGVEQG